MTSRVWFCTSFHAFAEVADSLRLLHGVGKVLGAVCTEEICPSTGRLHVQFAARFDTAIRIAAIRKLFGYSDIHCEKPRSVVAVVKYCEKFETWTGRRYTVGRDLILKAAQSLEDFQRALQDPRLTEKDLWKEFFAMMIRHHSAARRYRLLMTPTLRDTAPVVIIMTGPTGIGKSRLAFTCVEHVARFTLAIGGSDKSLFFDGYIGQELVVLDDYSGEIPYRLLLRLLDRHPITVQIKGGAVAWLPKMIIITSNLVPEQWYPMESLDPFYRRVTHHYTEIDIERDSDKIHDVIKYHFE